MQSTATHLNGTGKAHTNGTTSKSSLQFSTIAAALTSFRAGNFIVVLDDESRENEGDLIIAAQDVTASKMAFMIRHTSGYICAPITPALATKLDLPQMVADNEDPKKTAYTVSIDAEHEELTTGISAHDRALTCQMLGSAKAKAGDFRRPGHVLPLRARPGGVLERDGHTEAAVEFCRLAGKTPAGVICEMVEDGVVVEGMAEIGDAGMMRRDGCLEFGRRWGLEVCTIADLVEYVKMEKGGQVNGVETEEVNGVNGLETEEINGVNGHH